MFEEWSGLSLSAGEATRIFFAYLQAEDAGLAPDRAKILEKHPHIAAVLNEYFNARDLAQSPTLLSLAGNGSEAAERPTPPFVVIPSQDARLTRGFEVIESIGAGATGTVYRARVNGLTGEPDIALKLFHSSLSLDASMRLRDALILKGLDHPNLVRVYAAGESVNCGPFLATEYVPGDDLAEWLKHHGPLDERKAAKVLRVIARALHAAHDKDVLHLDIKPDNIFGCHGQLDSEALKVGDFGLGRFVGEFEPAPDDGRSFTTGGTTGYMAPEQYWGSSSPRSDIYALGALMLCMIGEPDPVNRDRMRARFLNKSQLAALEHLLEPEVQSLDVQAKSTRVLEVFRRQRVAEAAASIRDIQLRAIINKCLGLLPSGRYQSADELAEDLTAWLGNRPLVHAEYDYSKAMLFRMLLERCRKSENTEDHSKLWGWICLVLGLLAIFLSSLCSLLMFAGTNELVARFSTSGFYVAIWITTIAWALRPMRFRYPITQLFGYIFFYIVTVEILREFIVQDHNLADRVVFVVTGLLTSCMGLSNRLWRSFLACGVVILLLSFPVSWLLQIPRFSFLGPMLLGSSQGLSLLFFGIGVLQPRAHRPA